MSHECDVCGDEFDSERGLHVHQSQKHGDENNTTTSTTKSDGITLSTKQFGAAALAFGLLLGLVIGGLSGATAAGMIQDSTQAAPGGNTGDTGNTDNTGNNGDTGSQGSDTETIDMSKIEMDGEPVLGEEDAPVTMVIYEDFQCPFCKRFETETFPQIKSNYVDSGQVKIVWKDRPIPQLGHDWAEPAAAAIECVYRQDNDAFWKVKDELYTQAKTLTRGEEEFIPDNIQSRIVDMAGNEGLSTSAVQSCIDNDNPMDEVNADSQGGQRIGASGTPSFFINGKKIVGAQPYSAFESVIEEELS